MPIEIVAFQAQYDPRVTWAYVLVLFVFLVAFIVDRVRGSQSVLGGGVVAFWAGWVVSILVSRLSSNVAGNVLFGILVFIAVFLRYKRGRTVPTNKES